MSDRRIVRKVATNETMTTYIVMSQIMGFTVEALVNDDGENARALHIALPGETMAVVDPEVIESFLMYWNGVEDADINWESE